MGHINRIWEIDDDGYGRGGVDFEGHMGFRHDGMSMAEEYAYKKGCEHGYRKAMEEVQGGSYGERTIHRSGTGLNRVGYRDMDYRETGYEEPYALEERRRRDARGRYM